MKTRAVSEDQKREKQQVILKAVAPLFADNSFEEISMARIAAAAGVAKGTIFLYFASKEELFLGLMEESLRDWFAAIEERFRALPAGADPGATAAAVAASLSGRSELLRLLAILHTRLEANISLEAAVRFKGFVARGVEDLAGLFGELYPGLSARNRRRAVLGIYALIIGTQHLAAPSPIIRQALAEGGITLFPDSFEPFFVTLCGEYLAGALNGVQANGSAGNH